ncbi:methylated-DNA--[protein]-cysteine S-methyltransferase [Phycicoccus endophyticus]|uniref:methylated-DNA--[protein]-cysteine S-methyltransferase n=1 Tax=Phycicoccus endophyticus TaxID=1690220 RepID=A0A7G9R181_9MICO|nr:methylated-DNA--[protein]-cysteine S-methyltransferase [Phycicoccus endophyticus]NHI18875.1 methylated-DNA--[protein]-cysteine S-methyltransferase [Phycicoccus endophyticus]QNN49356.1 methylated-DNA--[protein]-cysteine S-methyltransferase [Phycicoccus endophyticus]GGL35883.1 methylated-DNA--protein-cysteine methyltransferase [Phycicoccus endophyticus]
MTPPTDPFTAFAPALAGPPRLEPTDVSYVLEDTSLGRMLLAVRDDGRVLTTAFAPDAAHEQHWLERVAQRVSPRVLRHPRPTDAVRRALEDFLAGRARQVAVEPDLALLSDFQRLVLTGLAASVGYGRRTTYAALAQHLGRPRAARAVGTALAGNPLCVTLPCHRVLPAAGGVGGYAGGPAAKEALLALEARSAG